MKQSETRSAWYHENFRARRKKDRDGKARRGWITVIIILLVPSLIAVGAIVFSLGARFVLFSDANGREYAIEIPGAGENAGDGSGGGYTIPAIDPREFFSQYYVAEETHPNSEIARTEPRGDWTVTLRSAEGCAALPLQTIYARCIDSIVGIEAFTDNLSSYHWGTGIVLSADGYIVTNQHIISGTKSAMVVLNDGTEYEALLVGEDIQTDLAVLKIEAEGLVPAEFGDSTEMTVGDEVAAIGNPLGKELVGTMTTGIISAINRDISMDGRRMVLLQTTAAINEGNSGGALINQYGQVIGVTNMKKAAVNSVTVEGLGFAIPSITVKSIVDRLIADGQVTGRPGLGITVGAIPAIAAERYGYPEGLYVNAIHENSDAATKDIRVGDIITAINGQPITTTQDVIDLRDTCAVGDTLVFTLWREGKTFDVSIKVVDQNELS